MEVIEHNENRLVIGTDFVLYVLNPSSVLVVLAIAIGICIFTFNASDLLFPLSTFGSVALVIFVAWVVASGETIFDCTFDKASQVISTRLRAAWRLGIHLNKKIPFHEVTGLLLVTPGRGKPTLHLQLKSTSYPFAGNVTAQLAEDVCDFLGTPLIIEVGRERVTRLPFKANAEDVGISATPCPKCGAPLPRIYPGLSNVKCTHCGMTMLLEWNEKLTSFRSRTVE